MRVLTLTAPLGMISAMGLSISIASQLGASAGTLEIIPAVSLVAVIGGAISMGMLFNRVKQLEKDREDFRGENAMLRIRTHDMATAITTLNFTTTHLTTVTEQLAAAIEKLRP